MSKAELIVEEILRERNRQIEKEGFTASHDDDHDLGELALAAACYAAWPVELYKMVIPSLRNRISPLEQSLLWPWNKKYDKRNRHDNRRRKIIAAALLVAEIERLDREEER